MIGYVTVPMTPKLSKVQSVTPGRSRFAGEIVNFDSPAWANGSWVASVGSQNTLVCPFVPRNLLDWAGDGPSGVTANDKNVSPEAISVVSLIYKGGLAKAG